MTVLITLFSTGFVSPPSIRPPLAPEDEELLRDDETVAPVKRDGIRRKERPTDKGVSWLVKTQYISPLSMESTKVGFFSCTSLHVIYFTNCWKLFRNQIHLNLQSLNKNQAKELREMKGGRNLLDNLNNRFIFFYFACVKKMLEDK